MTLKATKTCAVAIAACVASVAHAQHVKEIQADKFAYLKEHFSTESVSKSVLATFTKADPGALNFHKMVFSVSDKIMMAQATGTQPTYTSTWTYLNVGGPFLNMLAEQISNGFPIQEEFYLEYRGLLPLENQTVSLSTVDAPRAMTMKNIKAFESVVLPGPTNGQFEWQFQMAPHIQLMNFRDNFFHCTYGASYPASTINAKLTGSAQDLDCESRNYNNVTTLHTINAMLLDYGFAIMKQALRPSSTVTFTVEDVQID